MVFSQEQFLNVSAALIQMDGIAFTHPQTTKLVLLGLSVLLLRFSLSVLSYSINLKAVKEFRR